MVSPLDIFQFYTRNFPILHPKFSNNLFLVIYLKKLLSIQVTLKRNFNPKFSDELFSHYLPNKNFTPPIFLWKGLGVRDFYTFLLFLSKRSRKVTVRHDLLYDTVILQYITYIPLIFISRYAVPGVYRHKKALIVVILILIIWEVSVELLSIVT